MFKAVKRDEPLEAKGVDMQGLEEILPNEAAEPVKRKRRRRKRQAGYARPKKHYPEPTNDQIKDLSERQEKLMKKIYHTGCVAQGAPVRAPAPPRCRVDAPDGRQVAVEPGDQPAPPLLQEADRCRPGAEPSAQQGVVADLPDPPGEKSA